MKNNYDYGYEHPLMSAYVAVGGFAMLIVLGCIIYSWVQFFVVNHRIKDCKEIATFYQRSLPEGVGIKYISGSCVRTDNMTVMTGNEKY
jgi:hypothetical protein